MKQTAVVIDRCVSGGAKGAVVRYVADLRKLGGRYAHCGVITGSWAGHVYIQFEDGSDAVTSWGHIESMPALTQLRRWTLRQWPFSHPHQVESTQ